MDRELAEAIAVEGYIYLYPLVLMETTRRQMTNVEQVSLSPLRTPADVFLNVPTFPPAEFRAVVRPNGLSSFAARDRGERRPPDRHRIRGERLRHGAASLPASAAIGEPTRRG